MIAKVIILFAALAAVHASGLLGHGALVSTGVSNSARSQDAFGNYAFGYDIKDGLGAANSRSEVGDAHGNKKGSYTIADIDGRARRVDYVADGHGFRATVKTNEPGTAASAPAAALIASPYAGPVAPVVNHVAPAAPAVVTCCFLRCSFGCCRPSCLRWCNRSRSRPRSSLWSSKGPAGARLALYGFLDLSGTWAACFSLWLAGAVWTWSRSRSSLWSCSYPHGAVLERKKFPLPLRKSILT
ncbi:adult-specific rigid cuticular protein 15.7 [Trichonephila inaurata madagascariensis]|uniref:Adult-specific rigid cuticular protein 15.7 n=1 Tax=Trichonephila inaurata madagascariensis TaxID=2747483 RepID=A0A8X7C3D8_9ARAC|nr:adult-specific rigid cuticular protein 15.7 [Trichonephila inaurata madagascariensis]